VIALGTTSLAGSGCGGSGAECSPACRTPFECYYGVCLPPVRDGATADGDVDVPDRPDTPRDEATPEATPDVSCSSPAECVDGNACTEDLCDGGTCRNPALPDGAGCEEDGDPCTSDSCVAGTCMHQAVSGCCARDADCMWPDHVWECDPETHVCYDPPQGEVCDRCSNRRDCGDGGSDSDDWCVYAGWNGGCSKDCRGDEDCPGGTHCFNVFGGEDRPCEPTDEACVCVVRLGTCESFNRFGAECGDDGDCRDCDGCDDLVCPDGYCTWPCSTPEDCRWGAVCGDDGVCRWE
jgi:hypothetical protein